MKRFLSVVLAVMMIFSTVSFAVPSLVGVQETAQNVGYFEEPDLKENFEEKEETATLAAVDTTQYGQLVAKFTFDNLVSGTSYADAFRTTTASGNAIGVVGGSIGSGDHMNSWVKTTTPFMWDGMNNGTERHSTVVGAQDGTGNKYLQLTGTGSATRFAIRDYNGAGFAKAGHYIVTFDVLSASNTKPVTAIQFQGNSNKFNHIEYVEETVKTGEWSTVVVSYDDTHDKVTTETDYTSDQNTKANYLYFITDLDANEVLGVDNITLWWVPASVSFNVTHDVEGILEDGTYAIGGGVKTIKEIEAILDPNTDFRDAGYYLAGLRDENGFYTDKVAFTENGKSYTAVWDRLNLLLSYSFDGTEDLSNVAPVTGSTGAVKDGAFVTTSTADYASYRIDINNVSIPVADIGDIVYRIKNTGTGSFSTQYFVYVGKTEGTKTQSFKTTVPSEYTVISTTDLWGAPTTWMSSINTLTQFRVQGSALKGAVVHYDYIHVIAKNKDAGDNVLVDIDAPDSDLNSFKMLFDSTTTVQDVIDEVDLSDYSGKYFIKAFRAPDGTLLTGNDLIDPYVDDQDTLTAVWDSLNILDTNLEFDNSSILSKLGFRTGLNNALGSGFASIVDNSYMRVTFKGTDATKVIQDTGFNYNFSTPIEAGELDRIEMRVRFTGMPSVDTSLNQANGGTTAYTVTSVAWPEMYYNSAAIHDADNTISLFGKDGQWMIISYTAEEAKLSNVRLSQLRFDFFNFMPDGTTLDIDYIRFLGKALPNVTVAMEGKYGLEDVAAKFSETTTVADIVEKIDYVGAESVVGLTATKNGAALDNATLISSLGTDFITLYPVWAPNPDVGEYGDLLFEINFDKAATGALNFGQGLKVLSNLGGFVGKRYAADETMFSMHNGSGSNYVAQTTEIAERGAGDKYLKATTNTNASYNLFQIHTGGSSYYSDVDGYLLLTYDILWGDSAAAYPHDIAYNRSQQAEAGDQNEAFYGVKNGGWGYVVSTFDDEIGVSGIGGNSATMLPTTVNYIKIHGSSGVKAGETYGIDNIRLWWVPKTTNVTVKAGTNPYVTEQTIAVKTTATVNDLISKVQTGSADVSLAGLSLTEGGELLAPDTLLTFPYGKTLYPKWSMPATLTVDMGTNTGATPVVLTYKGSDTIGDVVKKIVDHGDMVLKGLSRTSGGAVLSETELVGTESEDVTLYAVWESYEYLENYGYEFNDGVLPYDSSVTTNNANRTLSVQDGYLTIDLAAKNGATGVYDTQIYLPLTTNTMTNPDKEIPAGVVTNLTARVRFRGVGTTSRTLSVDGKGNYTFNPANPSGIPIHWGAPGNAWGANRVQYDYDYNTFLEDGIVDGRWFTLNFSTTSGKLNLYDNGVGYLRFDFPCPMPDGTKIDVDYIRLVGDNDKVAYDGMSQYGEKVLEINFDNIAAGSQSFPEANNSNKTVAALGGEFNPKFNAANYESKVILCANSSTTTEIVANSDGTGNYLKYTAGANGTGTYLYFRNFATQPFVREDGYYIVTYDVKNNTSSAVPHTFRFNYNNKIEHAAENFVITEDGEWDHVVLYFDKEINPEKVQNGYTLDSINDVDLIKWHNTSSSKTGETICIDNITLWYVPKTVPVIIDNSAIGLEETLIEAYPTNGMATEDIAALLPEFANGKFVGLSTVEGGDLLYENRSPVSQILYSNWSIDTTLTVDMGENKKLGNMSIQIPAGSSIKVSDIEAKFIDHGDKIFAGLSYTAGGAKLGSNEVISASESGAVTIYALWNDYYTNDFYSVEFNHKGEGVVTGAGSSHLNAGKNSAYKTDAKDANGNAAPGDDTQALVWNEEGYLTMNFVASDYAKAQAEDNGYSAIVWDPFMEIDTLYDKTGDDTYLPAGDADYVVIRMRYRGMPAKNTAYWRADANSGAGGAYTLKPDNVFAPFYYYTTTEGESFGKTSKVKYVSLAEGSAYRENWFTVFIPASELTIDANNLYRFRLDPNDGMPDGSAIDVDFIRFIHTTDANKNFSAPDSREDRTSVRLARGKDDVDANGKERTGIRVIGEIATSTATPSAELGWMFTSSAKWNKSNGGSERSWYELKMDLYNPSSSFIKVGFIKEDGEQKVNFFENEGDLIKSFAAVLYNIPVKNYKSPFIVRPFAKMGNAYAYGEPFEINFLDTLEAIANSEGATPEVVAYYNECSSAYAAYLDANAAYDSDVTNQELTKIMSSRSTILSHLIIPTNDVLPTVSGNIVTMRVWKDGAITTINVSTKNAYPALLTSDNKKISEAYAEKPCVYYESNGVYYIKSLGRSTNAGGDYNGVEKSNPSAMEANVDGSALFLSEINNVVSPFQRLPIDDELVNGKESFFLGDFATGEFDFTFQRANSATRTISTGKTGIVGSDSKVVAKYNFPNGNTEWVSFAQAQLLKMGIDNNSRLIADGIDFTNLTYVVSNNTTSVGSAINQREYEDLAVLAGVVDVPATVNYTTTNFLAAKYNKVIVKTTSAASYVTVTFTRTDDVSDSIKYYAYGTTADGYRLFDVDLYGMAKYHSTIKSLTVKANSGSVSYAYLVEDPDYYSSADLANMDATMIFQDTNYQNGFYVRDMDQKMKKNEYVNYTFANNGKTPVWMIDPWYSYDYRDSANKASYELYNKASPTATRLADDSQGTKVVEFTGSTKTSTYADGSSHTGPVLSMTLNSRAIYDGISHTKMVEAGMTYWPHLLIEQNKEIYPVDVERNSVGAKKIFMEMDVKMTNYTVDVDRYLENVGSKILSFLLYSYIRPIESPNDRIWFGAQICSESNPNYPTWNRDTGASAYIYSMPQEVVFQGIAKSFYQQIQDQITETSFSGSGTSKTSMGWVHISIDITPYIQTAIDWANREDAFGIGRPLTRNDFYFDGVNIGFETHGNIDGTFEIANFNFVAYN